MLAKSVSGADSVPGPQIAMFSWCPHLDFPLCMERERGKTYEDGEMSFTLGFRRLKERMKCARACVCFKSIWYHLEPKKDISGNIVNSIIYCANVNFLFFVSVCNI